MEAGEIEFAADHDDRGLLRFRIEPWECSGNGTFSLFSTSIPVAPAPVWRHRRRRPTQHDPATRAAPASRRNGTHARR